MKMFTKTVLKKLGASWFPSDQIQTAMELTVFNKRNISASSSEIWSEFFGLDCFCFQKELCLPPRAGEEQECGEE